MVKIEEIVTLSKKSRQRRNRKSRKTGNVKVAQVVMKNTTDGKKRKNRRKGQVSVWDSYLNALRDPEFNPGVKIPDLVTFPSSTFQLTYDATLSTSSGGDGVFITFRPILGDSSTIYPITYGNNTTVNGNFGAGTNVSWASNSPLKSLYSQIRPVSAVAYLEYIGTSLADSGQVCGTCAPPGAQVFTNFTSVQALPDNQTYPLRNGIKVLWKPMDNSSLEYIPAASLGATETVPQIIIATSGGTSNVTGIRVRAVANFEGIPQQDTANIVNATPSPSDFLSLERAFNWMRQPYNSVLPLVGMATPFAAAAGQWMMGNSIRNRLGSAPSQMEAGVGSRYPQARFPRGVNLMEMD